MKLLKIARARVKGVDEMDLKEYTALLINIKFEGIAPEDGFCEIIKKSGSIGPDCIPCQNFYVERNSELRSAR